MRATNHSFSRFCALSVFLICGVAGCRNTTEYCNEDSGWSTTSDANWVVEQCGSYVSLGPYAPEPVQSLDDLPNEIRERVDRHLTNRFGASYYSSLHFVRGLHVDKDELYRVNPSAKDYKWTVYSYRLLYRISDERKGIKAYTTEIRLDQSGEVIQEIGLPPIRQFPEKVDVISTQEAYAIASAVPNYAELQGIDEPTLTEQLQMRYSPERESLVYQFRKPISRQGCSVDTQFLEMDAHSGELLSDPGNFTNLTGRH